MRTCTSTSTTPRIFSIQTISLHCPPIKTGFFFFKILEEICIRQSLTVLLYCQEKRVRLVVKITFSQTPTVRQVHHRGFWIDELLYFSFSAKATWVSSAGKRIEWDREERQHNTRHLRGLPTEKRALSRRAKTQMYSKDRQRQEREEKRMEVVLRKYCWFLWRENAGKDWAKTGKFYHAHAEVAGPSSPIF